MHTQSPTTIHIARVLITSPGLPHVELLESIADELGVTRRSVENGLRRLEEDGLITWHRKTRGGTRRPFWTVTVHTDAPNWEAVAESIGTFDLMGVTL